MQSRNGFSRIGFIAAAAGSAVGLGNIWGFPYEVGQGGGGIFVLIYLFFCFTLCFPVMLTEVAIGRRTQKNAVGAFIKLGFNKWKFIGMLGVLSGVLILSYYNVVAGWAFGYIFEMVSGNFAVSENFSHYTSDMWKVSTYAIFFMLATSLVVSRGISGGIEKAAKILMPVLILMILLMVLYANGLPNAISGLRYYIVPQSEITFETVYNAMGQAFFSLSLGMGALITFGSYVNKEENLISSVAIITLADVGIAVLAGLMIFPFIGYLSNGSMVGVNGGPPLIFETLPQVFASIDGGFGSVVGAVFFVLLCFAALTSTVSLMEVPVSYLVDEWKITRKRAVFIAATIIFMFGIPSLLGHGFSDLLTEFIHLPRQEETMNFMGFVMSMANDTFLPLGGMLIVGFTAFVWKTENLHEEIAVGAPSYKKSFLRKYLSVAITYIIPLILLFMFLSTIWRLFF